MCSSHQKILKMLWYFSVSATLLGCIVADPILTHPAHAHDPWRQQNDALSRRATPKKAPGDTIIDSIGAAMSAAIPLVSKMGINVTGDMTETLCKTFATGGFLAKAITSFAGSPNGKGPGEQCVKDNTGGSGLYKSKILEDPTLVNHTIYIPALPLPGNTKAPVIIWSNGFCLPAGTMFANFLNEIASHGYIVIADGPINHGGDLGHTTKAANALKALDWMSKNSKRLNVSSDLSNIAMAGQSCGGINVYGAAPDPRFKIAALFNSGDFAGEFGAVKKSWLKPIAYFEGGKADFSRPMV